MTLSTIGLQSLPTERVALRSAERHPRSQGGVVLFKLNESNDAPVRGTEMVGILLIVVYMIADSFTSNWQVWAGRKARGCGGWWADALRWRDHRGRSSPSTR